MLDGKFVLGYLKIPIDFQHFLSHDNALTFNFKLVFLKSLQFVFVVCFLSFNFFNFVSIILRH
jgi:hypothetical protein